MQKNKPRGKKMKPVITIPIKGEVGDVKETKFDLTDDGYSVTISRTTLDRYTKPMFDIDNIVGEFSELLFDIDKESRIILGVLAKNGPLNENQITNLGFRRSHIITRDIVRYRISNEKNTMNLLKRGFLIQKDGNKIGNIKNKVEKIYHLTFKGLIASLAVTKFEENYMVKKYKELISSWVRSYNIPEFAIKVIKYNMALFMIKNVIEGAKLTDLNRIEANLYSFNDGDLLIATTYPAQVNKKYKEMLLDIRAWFYIHDKVFHAASVKLARDRPLVSEDKANDDDFSMLHFPDSESAMNANYLGNYVKYWHDHIERVQYEDLEKFDPHYMPEDWEQGIQGEEVDIWAANILAKRILKKHNIHPNFSLIDVSSIFH